MYLNKCKFYTIRKRQNKPYFYCRCSNNIITLLDCKNCSNFILRPNKSISKRSSKQNKLEKSRNSNPRLDSVYCYYCHRYCPNADIHEIYGGSNRKRSIENGFVVRLCRNCHQDEKRIAELRIRFQKMYEKNNSRENFIKIFGKSYIKE